MEVLPGMGGPARSAYRENCEIARTERNKAWGYALSEWFAPETTITVLLLVAFLALSII